METLDLDEERIHVDVENRLGEVVGHGDESTGCGSAERSPRALVDLHWVSGAWSRVPGTRSLSEGVARRSRL